MVTERSEPRRSRGPRPVAEASEPPRGPAGSAARSPRPSNTHSWLRRGVRLTVELAKVGSGRSEIGPGRGDRRFTDPAWADNPAYRRVMQAYLAACAAVGEVVEKADIDDWRDRERARFLVSILTSATPRPTRWPATPPPSSAPSRPAARAWCAAPATSCTTCATTAACRRRSTTSVPSRRERRGDAGRRRLPRRRSRGPPVHPEHPGGPRAAGADDPAADQPLLLHGPRAQAAASSSTPSAGGFSTSRSAGATRPRPGDWNLDTYVEAFLRAVDVVSEITGSDEINAVGAVRGRDHDVDDAQHHGRAR